MFTKVPMTTNKKVTLQPRILSFISHKLIQDLRGRELVQVADYYYMKLTLPTKNKPNRTVLVHIRLHRLLAALLSLTTPQVCPF